MYYSRKFSLTIHFFSFVRTSYLKIYSRHGNLEWQERTRQTEEQRGRQKNRGKGRVRGMVKRNRKKSVMKRRGKRSITSQHDLYFHRPQYLWENGVLLTSVKCSPQHALQRFLFLVLFKETQAGNYRLSVWINVGVFFCCCCCKTFSQTNT